MAHGGVKQGDPCISMLIFVHLGGFLDIRLLTYCSRKRKIKRLLIIILYAVPSTSTALIAANGSVSFHVYITFLKFCCCVHGSIEMLVVLTNGRL